MRPVETLRPGDRVDLRGDSIVENDLHAVMFDDVMVATVDTSADAVTVGFPGWAVRFPVGHRVRLVTPEPAR